MVERITEIDVVDLPSGQYLVEFRGREWGAPPKCHVEQIVIR